MTRKQKRLAVIALAVVVIFAIYRSQTGSGRYSAHNPTIKTEAENTISQQVQANAEPGAGLVFTTCAAVNDTNLLCSVTYGGQQYAYTAVVDQDTGQLIAQRQP